MNERVSGPAWTFEPGVPQIARVHAALIGDKDNYFADRQLASEVLRVCPSLDQTAVAGRLFMGRVVQQLATAGIGQFLDIGAGLPQSPELHRCVHQVQKDARVVYVDADPLVLTHGRAMMDGPGIFWIGGDLTDPDALLDECRTTGILNFQRPIAVTLIHVTDYIPDAVAVVRKLMDAMPIGSALAITQYTYDFNPAAIEDVTELHAAHQIQFVPRGYDEFGQFFDGLEIGDPGIVPPRDWHPDLHLHKEFTLHSYAAVGRKVS